MPVSTAAEADERLFPLTPVPCLDVELNGAIVRANPAFCAMSGRTEEQLRALGLFGLVCQDVRDEVARALASTSESASFNASISRPSGELRWLEWHGVKRVAGDIFCFIAYDVTAARLLADEIQERERFLSTLLSNLPGMAYRCRNDPEWTMEFVSAGTQKLTGYTAEDFTLHRTVAFGNLIHPEDANRVWDIVQDALDKRIPFTIQYRIRTKSNEERWCFEQGQGVFAHDELLALEGFISDITERVRGEHELRDKLALIETQRHQIADLSLPIIEVWDGVLTLPVVGTLDASRAARIMEGLLEAVVRTQSEHVIVDLTAVHYVDAEVAEHLVAILRAVQLLGARGILSGIRPGAAQALVGLSTDLGGIPTTADLRSALRSCMKRDAKYVRPAKR